MIDPEDRMNDEEKEFVVMAPVRLYAKDAKQAAMKAFALHDTMTPEDYLVYQGDRSEDFLMSEEDKEEARRAYAAGEYFKETKI